MGQNAAPRRMGAGFAGWQEDAERFFEQVFSGVSGVTITMDAMNLKNPLCGGTSQGSCTGAGLPVSSGAPCHSPAVTNYDASTASTWPLSGFVGHYYWGNTSPRLMVGCEQSNGKADRINLG